MYSKNKEWVNQKEKFLENIREATKDKDIEGCTFSPIKEVGAN